MTLARVEFLISWLHFCSKLYCLRANEATGWPTFCSVENAISSVTNATRPHRQVCDNYSVFQFLPAYRSLRSDIFLDFFYQRHSAMLTWTDWAQSNITLKECHFMIASIRSLFPSPGTLSPNTSKIFAIISSCYATLFCVNNVFGFFWFILTIFSSVYYI